MCEQHRSVLHSMRAKRKRKDSEEESDYQPEVYPVYTVSSIIHLGFNVCIRDLYLIFAFFPPASNVCKVLTIKELGKGSSQKWDYFAIS